MATYYECGCGESYETKPFALDCRKCVRHGCEPSATPAPANREEALRIYTKVFANSGAVGWREAGYQTAELAADALVAPMPFDPATRKLAVSMVTVRLAAEELEADVNRAARGNPEDS